MTESKFHIMMLPQELTEKIMYMAFIGRESPDTDSLDSCRKVCRTWNEMIKRKVWLKPTKEWGIITLSMIEKNWACKFLGLQVPASFPSNKMIVHAEALGKSKDNLKTSHCHLKFTT